MRSVNGFLAFVAMMLLASPAWATVFAPGTLVNSATMDIGVLVDFDGDVLNPRACGGYNYATQTTQWYQAFGKWAANSSDRTFVTGISSPEGEVRMVGAFQGQNSDTYLLATGGGVSGNIDKMTRYSSVGLNPSYAAGPVAGTTDWVSTYAWTGTANQIVFNQYEPNADRSKLYLANVTPDPFAVAMDTTNANWTDGVHSTSGRYIRSVGTGSTYTNTAYYGDGVGGETGTLNFYALDIPTGIETLLGTFGTPKTGASALDNCIWTAVERGGYLYVQTVQGDADGNAVKVYNMTDATTLGSLVATYSMMELTAVTGASTFYGFDAAPDGSRMLFGSNIGKAFEVVGTPVPEPSAFVLAMVGLFGLLAYAWRRRR